MSLVVDHIYLQSYQTLQNYSYYQYIEDSIIQSYRINFYSIL